jgi:hypothetical protein
MDECCVKTKSSTEVNSVDDLYRLKANGSMFILREEQAGSAE